MATIELAPEVADDFDHIHASVQAISVLETNPMIGQPTSDDLRELIIGQRSKGYVALYRLVVEIDTVVVLAIRAQKEVGYE